MADEDNEQDPDDLAPDCDDDGDDLPEDLAGLVHDHVASPITPDNVDEEG